VNIITGLFSPDYSSSTSAKVYGYKLATEMTQIRESMGVCPQFDILFDQLTVREHILFFAQLKGFNLAEAEAEANKLTRQFRLEKKIHHLGSALSHGQRRRLSVAIALCGGSRFVVLDEPTAGMDPVSRHDLWSTLLTFRKGRTILLTTQNMMEADVLGDRVGIMSGGKMQCVGSTQFLKTTFGAGYKLIFNDAHELSPDQVASLTAFIKSHIPDAAFHDNKLEKQVYYTLPFKTSAHMGKFFSALEENANSLHASNYEVNVTSLEDVFMKIDQANRNVANIPVGTGADGIGGNVVPYKPTFWSQVMAMTFRKLAFAMRDWYTVPLILAPVVAAILAADLYSTKFIATDESTVNLIIVGIYMAGYFCAPGWIGTFVVYERKEKLKNQLFVMGCDLRAYWLGTFIADYLILTVPMFITWITWFSALMSDFYEGTHAASFFFYMLFNAHMIVFSYTFAFFFRKPRSNVLFMPIIVIILFLLPIVIYLILVEFSLSFDKTMTDGTQATILLWGIMLTSPHGAIFTGYLNVAYDYNMYLFEIPPLGWVIFFQIFETFCYGLFVYTYDKMTLAPIPARDPIDDKRYDPKCLDMLDSDVVEERERTLNPPADLKRIDALSVQRLRKVFPPRRVGESTTVALEDVAFHVEKGQIFGLLGLNSSGKTTALSLISRAVLPTAGNTAVCGHSVLTNFVDASKHIGIVTQQNSLWDLITVEHHLVTFARLRGIPNDRIQQVVTGTLEQMDLLPYRNTIAKHLTSGIKRKLCVAIALIGDPEVVLLDAPSAGLDPVSRRNLWNVILRTMSSRAVVLTTHSMDEAEALCSRIGIMVNGQIRALGSKQHLKEKFGSGFELIIKCKVKENMEQQIDNLSRFVHSIFPSALRIDEYGGLITYEIPKEEMQVGKAFVLLEKDKARLEIEDYTIAQPTLEQVSLVI
jgi:ATP-binding cassette subfamily A (ABC1) protein 3